MSLCYVNRSLCQHTVSEIRSEYQFVREPLISTLCVPHLLSTLHKLLKASVRVQRVEQGGIAHHCIMETSHLINFSVIFSSRYGSQLNVNLHVAHICCDRITKVSRQVSSARLRREKHLTFKVLFDPTDKSLAG